MKKSNSDALVFPVLPLRDVIVFPNMVIPLFVGREKSIKSLEVAMDANKQIMLVAQKTADLDDPQDGDIYRFGTLATVLQLLKLPDGTIKVLVEGANRAEIQGKIYGDEYFEAKVDIVEEKIIGDREIEILSRSVIDSFDQYVKLNKKIAPEVMTSLSGIDDPSRLADTIAAHLVLKMEEKQTILEISDVKDRIESIINLIENSESDDNAQITSEEVKFNIKDADRAETARQMEEWGFEASTISNALDLATDTSLEDQVEGMQSYRERLRLLRLVDSTILPVTFYRNIIR